MVVRLSDRVSVEWFRPILPHQQGWEEDNEIAVSDIGTIAAARITPQDGQEPFIAVSMYARWLNAHPSISDGRGVIYSDRSTQRIVSGLATFSNTPTLQPTASTPQATST